MNVRRVRAYAPSVSAFFLVLFFAACGGGNDSGGGGGGGGAPPGTPTGLTATPGNAQVALSWNASAGATSYHVSRSATSGGPYTQIATPAVTNYTDTSLTNGSTYYYVVAAANSAGSSANSAQVSAAPAAPVTNVNVSVDVLSNRHFISRYVYGGAFPKDAATITNSGMTVVRWGGNATSTYNWQLHTYNADNDYFFEDFDFCGFGNFANCSDGDSLQWIADVKAAGSKPLMTMPMLDWVAQSAETPGAGGNLHWTFSASQDGACSQTAKVDQFNLDAGVNLKSDCSTTMVASQAQLNRAYFPLLDGPPQAGDPANSVYRNQWAAALATAFGGGSCNIAYFALSSCHFYDMDNEIDIWGGTHVDVHPNPSGYDELRDVYLKQATNLKGWDPQAVRLGPVSCCWWFYWNGANGNDKAAHGGVDFLPWWLNEIRWRDQITGARTLDVFDIHAYPDGPDTSSWTTSQKRALAARIFRDYWDPTYTTESWFNGNQSVTSIEPNPYVPFRIPRFRAIVNSIYGFTPLAITEWSAAFAGESDFSTALGDADAYGILGRERVALSTRWTAPDPANPNFQALKLYTNYDSANAGHGFNPISVAAVHNADQDLFSVYAATNSTGNSLTLIVLNKDPNNAAQTSFAFNHFTPSQVTSYTLSQSSPSSIVAGSAQAWSSNMTFQPYTATLLVISGSTASLPANEWDLSPDATMIPASTPSHIALIPTMISGSGTLTLGSPVSDAGITVTVTKSNLGGGQFGAVSVATGNAPGFYHFSIPATDSAGVTTSQDGWIVVGKPAATLSKTAGDSQTGSAGTTLPIALSVTLAPGSSGGSKAGASVFFTTSAGSLTNVGSGNGEKIFSGSKVVAVTDSSGVAKVTLTLPGAPGPVTVTAEGPYGLGHPMILPSFSETAN